MVNADGDLSVITLARDLPSNASTVGPKSLSQALLRVHGHLKKTRNSKPGSRPKVQKNGLSALSSSLDDLASNAENVGSTP